MNKSILLFFATSLFCGSTFAQHADFIPPKGIPRNIIIITANGMGINQIMAATLKKEAPLIFSRFPVAGFTQAWPANKDFPTDSSTAIAIATDRTRNINNDKTVKPAVSKNIFDWAKEKKMMTGIITTNSVTSATPKYFAIDKTYQKDDEAIAVDYLNSDINILLGGGSRYFEKRYDGRNLLNEFRKSGYKIESSMRKASSIAVPKTIGLVEKYDLYRASERKNFLTNATISTTRAMTNPDGYFLLVDESKIEQADTLNNIKLLTEEILDLDKMLTELYAQAGNETLILVLGNFECGGLVVSDSYIAKNSEPNVKWTGKTPTSSLAPVFAYGPGATQFSGIYTLAEVYTKLESLMINRR